MVSFMFKIGEKPGQSITTGTRNGLREGCDALVALPMTPTGYNVREATSCVKASAGSRMQRLKHAAKSV